MFEGLDHINSCVKLNIKVKWHVFSEHVTFHGSLPVVLSIQETVFESPLRTITDNEAEEMNLKYYDSDFHRGAFLLPRFIKKVNY